MCCVVYVCMSMMCICMSCLVSAAPVLYNWYIFVIDDINMYTLICVIQLKECKTLEEDQPLSHALLLCCMTFLAAGEVLDSCLVLSY